MQKGGGAMEEFHDEDGQEYSQDSLRARSEQALGELAQALIDNPTLHNAVTAASAPARRRSRRSGRR